MPTDTSKLKSFKNQEDHLQTLLDLLPTFPPSRLPMLLAAPSSSQVPRPGHHSLLSDTSPPCPGRCPVWVVLCSLIQWVQTLLRSSGPQFQQGSPTLPTRPQLLTKLNSTLPHSHDLLSSVPIYCPAFLLTTPYTPNSTGAKSGSLEGDLFQIGEEFVEKGQKQSTDAYWNSLYCPGTAKEMSLSLSFKEEIIRKGN